MIVSSQQDQEDYAQRLNRLAFAHGLGFEGQTRVYPEDFIVDEELGFELDGEGPHCWLRIKKSMLNTQDVLAALSKSFSLSIKDIGLSGLKDRNGVTSQWFSLSREVAGTLPNSETPSRFALDRDGFEILEMVDHMRKLKRGAHKRNRFSITVRGLFGDQSGDQSGDQGAIESRLLAIRDQGVPNYFGPQRFGRNASNLLKAERYFRGELKKPTRQLKGFMLSAARSMLFNEVLSKRVESGSWNRVLPGDAVQFDGSGSFFRHDHEDEAVLERVDAQECHATGPLWGRGELQVGGQVDEFERQCLEPFALFKTGLEQNGLSQQRRALRLNLTDLAWVFLDTGVLRLDFTLPAGAFATSVLRECIIDTEQRDRHDPLSTS